MARRYKRRPVMRKFLYGRFGYKAWPIILLLALMYYLGFDPGSSSDYDALNESSDRILRFIVPLLVVSFFLFVFKIFRERRLNVEKDANREKTFRDRPWEYNRTYIELFGQVEHLFQNDTSYVVKRKITNLYRNLTKDGNHAGRHVHQRFLLSSPQLVKNENILVINNTDFKSDPIKKGDWVSIKGEYIHDLRHDGKKSKNFYGRLHYTHDPVGWVKKVSLSSSEKRELSSRKVIATMPKGPEELRE